MKSTQSIQYTVDESTWKPTAVLDPTTGIWLDDANLYDADGNLLLTEQFKGNSSMTAHSTLRLLSTTAAHSQRSIT